MGNLHLQANTFFDTTIGPLCFWNVVGNPLLGYDGWNSPTCGWILVSQMAYPQKKTGSRIKFETHVVWFSLERCPSTDSPSCFDAGIGIPHFLRKGGLEMGHDGSWLRAPGVTVLIQVYCFCQLWSNLAPNTRSHCIQNVGYLMHPLMFIRKPFATCARGMACHDPTWTQKFLPEKCRGGKISWMNC